MLKSLMMERPLSIPAVLDYAAEVHGRSEIVSSGPGGLHSQSYQETRRRVKRLANALRDTGVQPGDRVATLAWNGHRHFELYYAIASIGAVCHTINPRLFPAQISWIVHHAEDRILFFDADLNGLVNTLAPDLPGGLRYAALCGPAELPADAPEGTVAYEALLDGQSAEFAWPELPESTASGLCYTSGTTGNPKGALYSHRSTLMHAMAIILGVPKSFGREQRILPAVPLFHVNAWGLPFSAPLSGASLIMPGPQLDGASLFALIESQRATIGWGVPTVWSGLIDEMRRQGRKPADLHSLLIGGSAVSEAQIRTLEGEFGIEVIHGWGMTELSPVGAATRVEAKRPFAVPVGEKLKQGQRLFGLEMQIVDENGEVLDKDEQATGELVVRGNTVISGYFKGPEDTGGAFDTPGWFRTGDVAKLSEKGHLTLVDRTKDLIKSGGEWISSIDLENAACSCPDIKLAAAIAVPHEKWGERPLLAVVAEPGTELTEDDVIAHLSGIMAKWQLPDTVLFCNELPMTATGKISKLTLRKELRE